MCGMALPNWSAPRTLNQAKTIAAKFAAQKGGSAKKAAKLALTCAQTSQADTPYYVFNHGDSQGFTIVSSDDLLPEIVGYTDSGKFEEGNMPEGLAAFMDAYKATAASILAGDKNATDNLNELAAIRSARKATAVSPLLGSIAWNQTAPYNNQCPVWNGKDHAATGCVATAMAQVMAYYKHPATLQADIPSYTYRNTLTTEAIPHGEAYDWENMLPRYANGAYTEAQADAVAKLMFHCGAAVQSKYGSSTGANVTPEHLAKFFGYDPDLMQGVYRAGVTLDKWIGLLDGELQARRPILYAGSNGNGGHQFVLDGCDENGLYHINWGWGGDDNGYFDINILNPDYRVPSQDGYTWGADIIIGIAPDNGKADKPFVEEPSSHVSQNSYSITLTNPTRNSEGESFAGSVKITFANKTDTDFNGKVGLGIKDDNGNVKLISSASTAFIPKQDKQDSYYISIQTFNFDYAFPVGCTVLYGVYSYNGKTWHTCVPLYYMDLGKPDYLNLKATATEIKKAQRVDLTAGITADEVIRNTTNDIGIKLHNDLPEEYMGLISLYVSDTNEKPSSATAKYLVTVPAKGDATRTVRLSVTSEKLYVWVDDEAGDCILNGYELSTVTHTAPVLTLTSMKSNAVAGLYETENARYSSFLVKAPRTNEDKATFTYEIKNTGGKTYRTFCLALKGLPNYSTKRIRKTLTLEPNSVNYVTVEATPEDMGSRFIQCFLTMEDEKDGATLTYDVERQLLERVSQDGYDIPMFTGALAIYVGGKDATGIQQPTADDIFSNGNTVKVYNLQGTLIDGSATRESFEKLPQGVYIVNGKKLLKK